MEHTPCYIGNSHYSNRSCTKKKYKNVNISVPGVGDQSRYQGQGMLKQELASKVGEVGGGLEKIVLLNIVFPCKGSVSTH